MEHLQSKFLLLSLCLTLMSLPIEGEVRRGSSAGEAPSDTTLMREVSINGERQRISYRLDRQRIDATQLLTAQGGTAQDVLRSVPGVAIDADGALSFRGSQEFLVYVDGKPSPLTGTEALQMIGAASIALQGLLVASTISVWPRTPPCSSMGISSADIILRRGGRLPMCTSTLQSVRPSSGARCCWVLWHMTSSIQPVITVCAPPPSSAARRGFVPPIPISSSASRTVSASPQLRLSLVL